MSTLGQAATWGVGMGVGSSVGHAIGNSAMGMFGGGSSSRDHVEQPQQPAYSSNQSTLGAGSSACETENKAFMRCLEANPNDMNAW